MLVKEFPSVIQSISYTTRSKRYNEESGDDYIFITTEEFEQKIAEREFLEYVKLYGHYYGTSKKWVDHQQSLGKHVFLVIDTQGALQLMDSLDASFIFMLPPSIGHLKERLLNRNTDAIVDRRRWTLAVKEIEAAHYYQYIILNDRLEQAYQVLRSIVVAEEHKQENIGNSWTILNR